jgi:hypothetical protein
MPLAPAAHRQSAVLRQLKSPSTIGRQSVCYHLLAYFSARQRLMMDLSLRERNCISQSEMPTKVQFIRR